MSLRAPPAEAPAKPRDRLKHVLRAGYATATPVRAEAPTEKFIVIEDVRISIDPENWTPISMNDIFKLTLTPAMGDNAWNKLIRAKTDGKPYDPNFDAHRGIQFVSPYTNYRFWIKYNVPLAAVDHAKDAAYYLLARPSSDSEIYYKSVD